MAAAKVSGEPPDPWGGQFMLHNEARASLPPPRVPVSGLRTMCYVPEEDLLFEVLSSGTSSLPLSSEAIPGGREGVPLYR